MLWPLHSLLMVSFLSLILLGCLQDPLGDGNQASVIALDIRKRKGLKPNPSPLNEYEDKL